MEMSLKATVITFFSKLSGHKKALFLLLTIVAGIIILWPLHNFQYYLAQGDHGRDLYCFKKTMEGALPYRDYSWLFGPLMPYYYSIFYFFGGVSIQSVLLGQGLLILLAGIFVYLTCAVFLPPALSFVCALWYWGFRGAEFFHTYNHIGGLLALLITLYCLFQYIHKNRLVHVYAGFISILLFMLIRLNMGVSTLIAFVLSLFFIDFYQKNPQASRRRWIYIFLSFAVLGIAFVIYWFLLHPLPAYAIQQSFPYGKSQRNDPIGSPVDVMMYSKDMIISYFTATLAQKILGVVLILVAIQSSLLILSNKLSKEFKKNIVLVFGSLIVFLIFSSHEFVASGVFYRLFWIFPLIFIIIFCLIATATKNISSPIVKILILLTLFLPAFLNIQHDHRIIRFFKKPARLLHVGNNKIYTTQHPGWFTAVTGAVDFIRNNVDPAEKILVLPLDPLYLFLSERDSATRQLVFFDHMNIPEEQERKIISQMEKGGANWAVISSRASSWEEGLGVFGETYGLLLAKYLNGRFAPVAQFGDWVNPAGWISNHGVRILKKETGRGI